MESAAPPWRLLFPIGRFEMYMIRNVYFGKYAKFLIHRRVGPSKNRNVWTTDPYITASRFMSALLNDGSGNFTDGTAQVFGPLPGFYWGAIAVGQFTNDAMPDLIHIGIGDFCGPRVLLQRFNTSTLTSTSATPASTGSSSSANVAALAGGLGGGPGAPLPLFARCPLPLPCCCCALCCLLILVVAAATLLVAVVAAVGLGLFAAADAGVVFYLIRGRTK